MNILDLVADLDNARTEAEAQHIWAHFAHRLEEAIEAMNLSRCHGLVIAAPTTIGGNLCDLALIHLDPNTPDEARFNLAEDLENI